MVALKKRASPLVQRIIPQVLNFSAFMQLMIKAHSFYTLLILPCVLFNWLPITSYNTLRGFSTPIVLQLEIMYILHGIESWWWSGCKICNNSRWVSLWVRTYIIAAVGSHYMVLIINLTAPMTLNNAPLNGSGSSNMRTTGKPAFMFRYYKACIRSTLYT